MLDAVQNDLKENRSAPVAALQIPEDMPDDLRRLLMDHLEAAEDVTFAWGQHSSLRWLEELHHIDRRDPKSPWH